MNGSIGRAIAVALIGSITACGVSDDPALEGNGEVVTDTRVVEAFDSLSVARGVEVDLVVDPSIEGESELSVRTDGNLLEFLATEVAEGELTITVDRDGGVDPTDGLEVTGTIGLLRTLKVDTGSVLDLGGEPTGLSAITADTGAVAAITSLRSDLTLRAETGAVIELSGSVERLDLDLGSGAVVDARQLSAVIADVVAGTGAVMTVCVTGMVTGSMSDGSVLDVGCGATVDVVTTSGAVIERDGSQ